MINHDDSEQTLLAFYDVPTLQPTKLDDIAVVPLDPIESDDLKSLSIDQQFDLLSKLVKSSDNQYIYHDQDHEDPLRGRGTNVIKELLDGHVISSQNDPELNQFLISSRNFNSTKFLTTIHHQTPIEHLARSLHLLEKNIQSQNTELRDVIDDNYIKFVECKKSIDEVLLGFRNQKTRAQLDREKIRVFNPSRQKQVDKDNSYLIRELEESIKNLTLSTSVMIRPIMDNKSREQKIQKLAEFIKSHKFLFSLPSNLLKCVVAKDHDQILDDYHRYLKERAELLEEQSFRLNAINKKDDSSSKRVAQDYQIINTALSRLFREVDKIILQYRKKTYQELVSIDHEVVTTRFKNITNDKFLSLVDKMYRLDNSDGGGKAVPIFKFLKVQLDNAKKDFEYQVNKFDDKFQTMQKKLIDYTVSLSDHRESGSYIKSINDKYKNIEDNFKASTTTKSMSFEELEGLVTNVFGSSDNLDMSIINETWLILLNFVSYLKETFLPNINKFSNNYTHYYKMHKEVDTKGQIREEFLDLVMGCAEKLHSIFAEAEGVNVNQLESSPLNYSKFLPYYTNSLSTVFYLSKISKRINLILTTIGKNITAVGNVHKSTDTNKVIKGLRSTSGSINQKILEATCSVWVNDCSQFYDLETLEIDEGLTVDAKNDTTFTKLINLVEFYDTYILRRIRNLVFISDDSENSTDHVKIVSTFPSKRMLVSIEIQFMRSLNIIVDSIMKKYNIEMQKEIDNNTESSEIFKVLIMNNLERISKVVYPRLIANFDTKFEKDLSKQKLKLFSDIDKVNLTIFDDIISREKYTLDEILAKFFVKLEKDSMSNSEIKIDNFIYEMLVHFVKLVYNVKPLTNIQTFVNIISELQKFSVQGILDNIRKIKPTLHNYNIIIINLKLDISFFVEVFESSTTLKMNDYCFNIVDIIINTIGEQEKQVDVSFFSNKKFDAFLMNALKDSASQFDCLSR